MQNRLIPAFHYALKPAGTLFLGPAEGPGNHPGLFAPINRKWRLYQARPRLDGTCPVMRPALSSRHPVEPKRGEKEPPAKQTDFAELTNRVLLQTYAPASVITDEQGQLLYVHGDTGKYLRPAPGQPSLNVVEMARKGLES